MSEQRALLDPKIQESLVLKGDLSGLSPEQKKQYYLYRCNQVGLDPAAKPFDLLTLNGKEVLYANANATQQLCNLHKLSTQITHREKVDGIYLVSVRVTGHDGRVSENQGAVSVEGLSGEKLANALLKATTKAVRRSVLAHIGLGMLDESEVESIPEARKSVVEIQSPSPFKIQEVSPVNQGAYKVMLPGVDEPYSYAHTPDGWVINISTVIDKIVSSAKYTPEQKMEKFRALLDANESVSNSLDGVDFQKYDNIIRRVQAGLSAATNRKEAENGV